MIVNSRNTKLKISFGLGKYETEISHGQPFNVWVENVYPELEVSISTTAGVPLKISDFQYQITPVSTGTFEIIATVENRDINKKSNTLTVEVK